MVRTPNVRARVVTVAKSGAPPVTAISDDLIKLVGPVDAKLLPIRQFAGRCVRAVLEEEGFEVAETGVRLSNDPVFRTAAVYRQISGTENTAPTELLVRIAKALTDSEVRQLLRLLKQRLVALSSNHWWHSEMSRRHQHRNGIR